MNKQVFAVLFSILTVCAGLPRSKHVLRSVGEKNIKWRPEIQQKIQLNADLCPLCIQFTDEALEMLLNIILNMGVIGSCEALCTVLEQETGSKVLGAVCNILCDIEGIREFINLIEKADLDPIYFCELLKVCKVFDGGDATLTSLTVTPQSGPQGEKQIQFSYVSKNGTGTGEYIVAIDTVDGIPVEDGFLIEPQPAGAYTKNLKLDAEPDPDCDPTEGPCENWLPGNYTIIIEICNGECGSKHPHSKVYDRKQATFFITNGTP